MVFVIFLLYFILCLSNEALLKSIMYYCSFWILVTACSQKMQNENTDTENSPPPSQPCPRYTNQQNKKSPQKQESHNVPQKKELLKRGLKRKFTGQKTVEAKIAKTELSIEKLEKHITCETCPKSLQYPAKPNVVADMPLERELRHIKLKAEQSLISALTRFHKRKL